MRTRGPEGPEPGSGVRQVELCPIPAGLVAPGSGDAPFRRVVDLDDLPPGALVRVSFGDLDLLVAHIETGIVVTDDRCPHMSAPLSLGALDGCVIACVLHRGRFDLATGETVTHPTTGCLDADGGYREPWTPAGSDVRTDTPGPKASARALTRTRRLRFYPARITGGTLEVRVPTA